MNRLAITEAPNAHPQYMLTEKLLCAERLHSLSEARAEPGRAADARASESSDENTAAPVAGRVRNRIGEERARHR